MRLPLFTLVNQFIKITTQHILIVSLSAPFTDQVAFLEVQLMSDARQTIAIYQELSFVDPRGANGRCVNISDMTTRFTNINTKFYAFHTRSEAPKITKM